jgi:tripartite-type tricarboxylate transporter receptor subunit TctC
MSAAGPCRGAKAPSGGSDPHAVGERGGLMRGITRREHLAWLGAAFASGTAHAQASDYPRQPVRIVVPASPGGTVDTTARLLADGLTAHFKQTVVVENRGGANGALAADAVAKSKPDGYTLLMGNSGFSALPLLQKSLPYQQRDLQPVAIALFTPFVLFAGPKSEASSVDKLVAYAKANPGKLTAGSGDGTTLFACELFKAAAGGLQVVQANYRGGAQMIQDIAGGQVDFGFLGATAVMPLAKAGRLKVLGVASANRLAIAPEIPTLAEQGVRGVLMEPWGGLMVPRGTDPAIVRALEQAMEATTRSEAFTKKVNEIGSIPRFLGTQAAVEYIANESRALEQVAAQAGIKAAD